MHENAIDTVQTLHEETMNPSILFWLVYALWTVVIVYLIAAAAGVSRDTETHLGRVLSSCLQ